MKQTKNRLTTSLMITLFGLLIVLSVSSQTSEEQTAVDTMQAKDSILAVINTDYQSIKPILQKSCFDCHSDQTDYPWYHSLPVIGSMIDDHIKEGREHLDLSNDFPFGTKESLKGILHEIKGELESGDMPLAGYQLFHWNSAIEGEAQDSVFAWIDSTLARMEMFRLEVESAPEPTEDH
ncbi:MAG: heme-binding domain-containing protein [bacterium]|nr:heme-binding domain-containing protein [bacterium]